MGFLTPALLGGALLITVPILLHLIMRRQPRQFSFPALQFVKKRQQANRRRMNFRHLLLLALRCLLIAGIAVALARPTLLGSGLQGKEGAPLAVALVLDNSLRMQYVQQDRTRMQEAQEMAKWLIGNLPEETEIAVQDLSHGVSSFVVDRRTAESRVQNMGAETNPRPMIEAIRQAVELVTEEEDRQQELFIFSDLSTAVFDESALAELEELLAEAPDVRLYLVDVGAENPRNVTLAPLDMRSSSLRPGEHLSVEVELTSVGVQEEPLVEIFLQDTAGELRKRGQRIVELDAEGRGQTTFSLGDLPQGIHQGMVQLAHGDPLDFDNRRYFTVQVQPAARVLLLAENSREALFLREALSPSLLGEQAVAQFETTTELFRNATSLELSEFNAICLLDPPPLSDELWERLADYASDGGGLGIFLGHRALPSGFNAELPQRLLPGELKLRSRQETYFRPQRLDHPALRGLRDYAEDIPWQVYPVWTNWEFSELAGDAFIVARFANQQPALFDRPVGRGRVLTLATPVSDPLQPAGRAPWNLLPTHPEPWPFVALSNQLVSYLARSEETELNFKAGETVNLRLPPARPISDYVLRQPTGDSLRRTLPPGDDFIRISTTRTLGNYRVVSGGREGLDKGFSINADEQLSELTRVPRQSLLAALPNDRVHLARNLADVEHYVDIGRTGRELFSWAIILVTLVWGSEHLLANRFYRGEPND